MANRQEDNRQEDHAMDSGSVTFQHGG